MTYKKLKERRKSVKSPPRNAERSKEPIADIEDEKQVQEKFKNIPAPADSEKSKEPMADIEDDKQVQKDNYKTIPVPSPLYNEPIADIEDEIQIQDNHNNPVSALSVPCHKNKIQQQEENDREAPIEDIEDEKQTRVNRNNPVSALSVPCSKYTLNRIRQQEENDTEQLEDLRELSAGFRQKQDEASRRFKSKTSGSMHYHLDSYINQVAPVASKEERSSHKERETLNIPVPTENQLTFMDGNMEEEVVITTEGGLIEILGTGVSLEIPPGALEEEQLIKMRIVSDDYQDELSRSFGSNSSVVVELLPSNLQLLKPAKLTLPHCLVLKKGCEWKAKIYTSHHEEGNQPFWEEDPFALSEMHEKYCVIWLQHFSWWKFIFGIKKEVKGKRIILYAARRNPSPNSYAYVDVGFYLDLPGGQQAVDLKNEDILRKQHVVFNNKEELPLTISFEDSSSIWTCSPEEENPKQISFGIVAEWKGCYSTFLLKVQENSEIKGYSCYFKAGQGTNLEDLKFPLEICLSSSASASDAKTANIKQPPAAEETMETSSSAETATVPSDLCSAHLSISRGEPPKTIGPASDYAVSSTCPECIDVLQFVAEDVAEWWVLGRKLHLKEPHINIIKADYTSCKERSFQMLIKWIKEYGSGANYMVLGKALKDAGRLDLQQKVAPVAFKEERWSHKESATLSIPIPTGNQPFWEEDPFALSELNPNYCEMWLQHFCWETFQVGNKIVEGKRIVLYAARSVPSPNKDAYVDVGFYLDLPGGQQAVDLKTEDILRKQHVVFYNKDELPLTIWFEESSSIWTYKEANPKKISFGIVAEWKGCYSTFVLKVQENSETKGYSCYFKAGQGTNLVDLKFPLEICLSSSESASDAKTANIKQPPAAEETMETSSSAETATIPSNLCATHLSISRGELTSGPPLDFPATSTCHKCIAVLEFVAEEVADKWWVLGRKLHLKEAHIKIIKADNTSCEEQSFQMLIKWIKEYGTGANYMVLGKALEDARRLDLQQEVERKIKNEHI